MTEQGLAQRAPRAPRGGAALPRERERQRAGALGSGRARALALLLCVALLGCPPRPLSAYGEEPQPPRDYGTGTAHVFLTFRNGLSHAFDLRRIELKIDGATVLMCGDDERSLDAEDPILVWSGNLAAGEHEIDVDLEYRGRGHGIFTYLQGYRFRVRSSRTVGVPGGAMLTVEAEAWERGDETTALEDRPRVRYHERLGETPEPGLPGGCPWAEE